MNLIEKCQVKYYHSSRLKQWEDNRSKIQGWTTPQAQQTRFEVIATLLDFNDISVLDLGCGDGDLRDYLDARFRRFDYIGVDQQPEFIAYAKKRYADHRHTWFHQADFTRCQLPKVDIVVVCGALSYHSDNPNYYPEMIRKFYASANRAFIFNMLNQDFFQSGPLLVAHNKDHIYHQCLEWCDHVHLETGYLDNDFTIVMSRDPLVN